MDNTKETDGRAQETSISGYNAKSKSYEAALRHSLILLAELLPGAPDLTGTKILAWCWVLESSGIQEEEIGPAMLLYAQRSKFFPAPCEIIELAKALRKPAYHVASTPVLDPRPLSEKEIAEREEIRARIKAKHGLKVMPGDVDDTESERRRQIEDLRATT